MDIKLNPVRQRFNCWNNIKFTTRYHKNSTIELALTLSGFYLDFIGMNCEDGLSTSIN